MWTVDSVSPLGYIGRAMAETIRASGTEGGGAFTWWISYDDQTRDVTAFAQGTGICEAVVTLANDTTRSFLLSSIVGQGPTVVASNVNPRRIVDPKEGPISGYDGLTVTWRRA